MVPAKLRLLLFAVPMVLLLISATDLKVAWLVPSGHVEINRSSFEPPTGLFCALTFDDGPDELYTDQVRGILDENGIHGTFFVIGNKVEQRPDVVRRLVASGHEIGNHSFTHPTMTGLSREQQSEQINRTQKAIARCGAEARWFRPPFGEYNRNTVRCADEHGLETILWTADPRDWSQPGVDAIASRVRRLTGPGAVVLLHSTNAQTVAALKGIIEDLRRHGYRFVTMSEWRILAGGYELPEPPVPQQPQMLPSGSLSAPTGMFYRPFMPGRAGIETASCIESDAPRGLAASMLPLDSAKPAAPSEPADPAGEVADNAPLRVYSNFSSIDDLRYIFERGQSKAGFNVAAPSAAQARSS